MKQCRHWPFVATKGPHDATPKGASIFAAVVAGSSKEEDARLISGDWSDDR